MLQPGPALPLVNGYHEADDDDCWSESSTLSNDETSLAKYSAAASNVVKPYHKITIVPKERKGEIFQALTMPAPLKNALEDIGHTSKDDVEEKIVLAPKNPFETCSDDEEEDEVNNRTLRSTQWSRDQDETLKRTYSRHDREDTESTAPTLAIGLEGDRLAEVRPYAHIPGKRKAPKVPPDLPSADHNGPNAPQALQTPAAHSGASALESSIGSKPSVAKIHSGLNQKPVANKDQLVKPDKPVFEPVFHGQSTHPKEPVVKLEPPREVLKRPTDLEIPMKTEVQSELDKPVSNGFSNDFFVERFEVQSPKPWYKKNPFSFDKVIGTRIENQDSGQISFLGQICSL